LIIKGHISKTRSLVVVFSAVRLRSVSKLKDDDLKRKFVMSDPIENERIDVFGTRYKVWQIALQSLVGHGFVGFTQREISFRAGISERAVQSHFAAFKDANMIERKRDSHGRMRFWVCPEHYWNYKNVIRNKYLGKRKKPRHKTKTGNELKSIEGGRKSA